MLEALHHPIEIVRFGLELADGGGGIGGDEYFLSGFRQHGDLDLAKGAWGHIVFELIHQLEIFVGHFEDRSPDLFSPVTGSRWRGRIAIGRTIGRI